MSFETQLTALRHLAETFFGQAATLTNPGDDAQSVTAVVSEDTAADANPDDGQGTRRTVTARVSDTASVQRGATLTITATGESWTVERWGRLSGGWLELALSRTQASERTQGKYRRT